MKGIKKTHEEFIMEIYDLVGEEFSVLESYINAKTKIKFKHNVCGHEWKILPSGFLVGNRCPLCKAQKNGKSKRKTHEQYIFEVYSLVADEYEVLGEYKNSYSKIKIKHRICNYEWDIVATSFLKGTRCPKCAGVNRKTTDDFKSEVFNIVGNEYLVLGEYQKSSTKIKMKHVVCENKYYVSPNNFLRGYRCPTCSITGNKSHQQFSDEVINMHGNRYEILSDYKTNAQYVTVKHECGYIWDVLPTSLLGSRKEDKTFCPQCNGRIKMTTEIMSNRIHADSDGMYEVTGEYKTYEKIKIKHTVCDNEFEIDPYSFIKSPRCIVCVPSGSRGERRIEEILSQHQIKFESQYAIKDCFFKIALRFDFAILSEANNIQYLIEYDGIHHFEPVDFAGRGRDWAEHLFKETIEKDSIKNQYCISNGIPLIRIPYWEYNNIPSILSKIKSIENLHASHTF